MKRQENCLKGQKNLYIMEQMNRLNVVEWKKMEGEK